MTSSRVQIGPNGPVFLEEAYLVLVELLTATLKEKGTNQLSRHVGARFAVIVFYRELGRKLGFQFQGN